jgi:3-hydroxy-9,10-secoandrosta-1,3,5(10)-triene-9,17-dione monooxygenase
VQALRPGVRPQNGLTVVRRTTGLAPSTRNDPLNSAVACQPLSRAPLGAPDPALTTQSVIARAAALRPMLRMQAEDNERRGHYADSLHQAFRTAGFYRLLQPRSMGGHELDYSTFFRTMLEISRGHPSTGWCLTLAASHAPLVAAHWSEEAQLEIFGDGHFAAPHRVLPGGSCERVQGGYLVDGVWPWSSGIPHSTHFIGTTALEDAQGGPPHLLNVVVPKGQYTILDDWGGDRTLGLKGSGSNSVRLEKVFVPEHMSAPAEAQHRLLDPSGTQGTRLHGNPMYLGLVLAPYQAALVTPIIGAALAALDEYHDILLTQLTPMPPRVRRADAADCQRPYGEATAMTDAAQAILLQSMQQYTELGERWQRSGQAATAEEQLRLVGQLQRAGQLACEAVELLFHTAGSSAARQGARLLRYMGDVQMYRGHVSAQTPTYGGYIGRARLGLPTGFLDL